MFVVEVAVVETMMEELVEVVAHLTELSQLLVQVLLQETTPMLTMLTVQVRVVLEVQEEMAVMVIQVV